jgi:predicted nucleic acid-binding protein
MKEKLFIDTDVIIDIAINREPFSIAAAKLLSQIEYKNFIGYTSSLIFNNVYYVQRKVANSEVAIHFLKKLRLIVKVLGVDDIIIQKALESSFSDFEDAIQYYTSTENNMDYIITRNVDDYKKSIIPVHTPDEFLKLKTITGK